MRGRRTLIDALIALASLTAVFALVVAIDDRAGDQVARVLQSGTSPDGRVAVQLREDTMTLARSVWEMCRLHAPLMTFAGVAAVLVLFMIRTK